MEEGSFIVLIFEKMTRKRGIAKTLNQLQKLRRSAELKHAKLPRYEEELALQRDSKMRRFCNYFVTLFNQRKIDPFTQFIKTAHLAEIKIKV